MSDSKDIILSGNSSSGDLIEVLCQRYPLQGVGPLAWLEAATNDAHKTGQSLVEIVNHWCAQSELAMLSVTFDVGAGLTVTVLDVSS
ncbi:hypothetical protein [Aeromonas enteropelogenes]|uniref:hypothetical protein n=1 Tax=Aeromonas TaxID=642 RepID=UPI003B9E7BD1